MIASGLVSYLVATTPLGGPVVPEVYIIPTPPLGSSRSTSGSVSAPSISRSKSQSMPSPALPSSTTEVRSSGQLARTDSRASRRSSWTMAQTASESERMWARVAPALRRVDRHRVRADEDDAEVGPEELGPVGQQQGHLLAGPHAELQQAVGRPLGVGQHVPPGDLLVLPFQPRGVRVVGHPLANRLLDGALCSSHSAIPLPRRRTGERNVGNRPEAVKIDAANA